MATWCATCQLGLAGGGALAVAGAMCGCGVAMAQLALNILNPYPGTPFNPNPH
jgi:hypothetical protein